MKQMSIVLGHQAFMEAVRQTGYTYRTFTLLNEMQGDQLTVEPDKPAIGLVTLTAMDQSEEVE